MDDPKAFVYSFFFFFLDQTVIYRGRGARKALEGLKGIRETKERLD